MHPGMSRIDSNSSVQSDRSPARDSCAAVPAVDQTVRNPKALVSSVSLISTAVVFGSIKTNTILGPPP